MGYHKNIIPEGKFGEFSKIKEEFLEAEDAFESNNPIMLLQELSDLIGAIEGFPNKYSISIDDLLTMKNITEKVFLDGTRKSKQDNTD